MCTNSNTCPQKTTGVLSVIRSRLEEMIKQMNVGEKVMCCLRKRWGTKREEQKKWHYRELIMFFCSSLFYVTGRVDRFGVRAPSRLYNKVLCVLCVLMLMHYTVCYFTGIFYAVVRHISMLFTDNKDSGFWMDSGFCWCSSVASCLRCSLSPILSLTGSYQHLSMGLLAQLSARQLPGARKNPHALHLISQSLRWYCFWNSIWMMMMFFFCSFEEDCQVLPLSGWVVRTAELMLC